MLTKPSRPFAVVVDTNILIRAFLSGKLGEDRILQIVLHRRCDLMYSRRQLHEFTAVLGYERIVKKYTIDQTLVQTFLQWVSDYGKEVDAEPVKLCRDPSDNHILGLALHAARNRTVYMVTGDQDILSLRGKVKRVAILTAGEFLKRMSG